MIKEYAADAGSALATTEPTQQTEPTANELIKPPAKPTRQTTDTFANLSLALLESSLTNPRKTFRADKLAELADSIRASGVHQPILVRPLPASRVPDTSTEPGSSRPRAVRPTHEIVSGERRYRASLQAQIDTIPAMIRNLTDAQVLEIQIIENLQRDDLTELEEAEGYEQLCAATGMLKEAIGDKIGKSRSYVYGRLKLLHLSPECKQALREGSIDTTRALLIARIPDTALQAKALVECKLTDFNGDAVHSARRFSIWLQANVMLKLEQATFKISDAHLVESAGSCNACPKRTGASPDLFVDVHGADICTDPVCYALKTEAHRTALRLKAQARGMRIIDGREAKEICSRCSSTIIGYSRLSELREDAKAPATLGKLLGKDAPAPVLIENPWTFELIEAVPTQEADGILLAKGLIKSTQVEEAKERDSKHLEWKIENLKNNTAIAIEKAANKLQYEALSDAVRASPDDAVASLLTPALLRAWLIDSAKFYSLEEHMATAAGIELPDNCDAAEYMRLHLQAAPGAQLYRTAVLWMVGGPSTGQSDALFKALAQSTGTKLDDLHAQASLQVKAETRDKLAAIKKELKAAQPTLPGAPDAAKAQDPQADATAPVKPSNTTLRTSANGKGKGKLTPQQALSGISDAMQTLGKAQDAASTPNTAEIHNKPSGFVVGQRVRVTSLPERLGFVGKKWSGKEGLISETNAEHDPDLYDVTFRGRNGGIAMFRTDQLEAA